MGQNKAMNVKPWYIGFHFGGPRYASHPELLAHFILFLFLPVHKKLEAEGFIFLFYKSPIFSF